MSGLVLPIGPYMRCLMKRRCEIHRTTNLVVKSLFNIKYRKLKKIDFFILKISELNNTFGGINLNDLKYLRGL